MNTGSFCNIRVPRWDPVHEHIVAAINSCDWHRKVNGIYGQQEYTDLYPVLVDKDGNAAVVRAGGFTYIVQNYTDPCRMHIREVTDQLRATSLAYPYVRDSNGKFNGDLRAVYRFIKRYQQEA